MSAIAQAGQRIGTRHSLEGIARDREFEDRAADEIEGEEGYRHRDEGGDDGIAQRIGRNRREPDASEHFIDDEIQNDSRNGRHNGTGQGKAQHIGALGESTGSDASDDPLLQSGNHIYIAFVTTNIMAH
jgi:hypothetical protein